MEDGITKFFTQQAVAPAATWAILTPATSQPRNEQEDRMTVATHALAPLQDRSIMVVEDEFFQAKDLTQAFSAAGARLVGPSRR